MIETRLDMQRAKLESIARARSRREDELAAAAAAPSGETAGLSPIDMVDSLASSEAAEPLTA